MGGMVVLDNIEVDEEQIITLLDTYWNGIGNNLTARGLEKS